MRVVGLARRRGVRIGLGPRGSRRVGNLASRAGDADFGQASLSAIAMATLAACSGQAWETGAKAGAGLVVRGAEPLRLPTAACACELRCLPGRAATVVTHLSHRNALSPSLPECNRRAFCAPISKNRSSNASQGLEVNIAGAQLLRQAWQAGHDRAHREASSPWRGSAALRDASTDWQPRSL